MPKLFIERLNNNAADKIFNKMVVELLDEWNKNGGGSTLQELSSHNMKTINNIYVYLTKLKLNKVLEIDENQFLLVHAGLGNFEKDKPLKKYNIM